MEEDIKKAVFFHPLPAFGVECFGSVLIHEGRFSRTTGIAPAPPVIRYRAGHWLIEDNWLTLARHQLNTQPGAWVSSFIDVSERHAERAIATFGVGGTPEHIANGLCELYGVLAPSMVVLTLLDGLLERRLLKMFEHIGLAHDQQEPWLDVFRYPEKKTHSMKEREAFFSLASFVQKHSMDQSTRRRVGVYADQYGYLGLMTPIARPLSFTDMLHRVTQLSDEPKAMQREEEMSRMRVLARATEFMNNTGLDALERDAIRAYRDVAYWKLRQQELWALIQVTAQPGIKRLSNVLECSPEQVLSLGVEELSSVLINPKQMPSFEELDRRVKGAFSALFVEDLIEPEWN